MRGVRLLLSKALLRCYSAVPPRSSRHLLHVTGLIKSISPVLQKEKRELKPTSTLVFAPSSSSFILSLCPGSELAEDQSKVPCDPWVGASQKLKARRGEVLRARCHPVASCWYRARHVHTRYELQNWSCKLIVLAAERPRLVAVITLIFILSEWPSYHINDFILC